MFHEANGPTPSQILKTCTSICLFFTNPFPALDTKLLLFVELHPAKPMWAHQEVFGDLTTT